MESITTAFSAVAASVLALPVWVLVVLTIFVVLPLAFIILMAILINLPKRMSKVDLPNGLKVWQWNQGETDWLYEEIFKDDLYTSRPIQLNPGAVVFDCGANIGMFAVFCHHKTGGDVQVHSFEPMPKIHQVCAANARLFNGDGPKKLHTYQVGLSDKPTSVTFDFHPHFSIWSTSDSTFDRSREERILRDMPAILNNVRWLPNFIGVPLGRWLVRNVVNKVEKVQAELTTLATMVEQTGVQRIDLLKIDVEGAEMAVLRGMSDEHWPKVQQVVMEAEDFNTVTEIKTLLESKGFRVTSVASEREKMPGVTSEVSCVMGVRP